MTDASGARLADLLARLPTRRMRRRLVRCVPQLDFDESDAPSYLFTSGRPNRCNPAGVDCLYFSETEATAQTEYRQAWRGTAAEHQPKLTFTARVRLRRILNLGSAGPSAGKSRLPRSASPPLRRRWPGPEDGTSPSFLPASRHRIGLRSWAALWNPSRSSLNILGLAPSNGSQKSSANARRPRRSE